MNDRLDDLDTVRFTRATHEVTNQVPPFAGHDAYGRDPGLRAPCARTRRVGR